MMAPDFQEAVKDTAAYLSEHREDLESNESLVALQQILLKLRSDHEVITRDDGNGHDIDCSGREIGGLVAAAKTDPNAESTLRAIATSLVEKGRDVPAELAGFLLDPPKRKRGRRKGNRLTDATRNAQIALAVHRAKQRGFPAFRNNAGKQSTHSPPSACLVVHEALSAIGVYMTEANVERIWLRYSHLDKTDE